MNRAARRHAIADGEHRVDPLSLFAEHIRQSFGVTEGNSILQESLDRMPAAGGFEKEYIDGAIAVIVERHPELADDMAKWVAEAKAEENA